jgi:hypothetical protein
VLIAVDALLTGHDLDDDHWAALVDAAGEDGAVDVLLLTGWYQAISYVARATRLDREPGTPAFASVS